MWGTVLGKNGPIVHQCKHLTETKLRSLVAIVVIMAAKGEVRWRSVQCAKGCTGGRLRVDGQVHKTQDFGPGDHRQGQARLEVLLSRVI